MPWIKMKQSHKASPDGIIVLLYEQGQSYKVTERLAEVMADQIKVAERINEPKPSEPETEVEPEKEIEMERKSEKGSPMDKSAAPPEKKKTKAEEREEELARRRRKK